MSRFFKKPDWLKEQAQNQVKNESKPDEKKDATSMFARSTGTVSDVLAEQKRKEALKAEKKAQKVKIKEDADAPSRKRRKTSEDGNYEGDRESKKYDCTLVFHALNSNVSIETQYHRDVRREQETVHRRSHLRNAMKPRSLTH
jgi:hypothetical protein